jgi:hypothetical protein
VLETAFEIGLCNGLQTSISLAAIHVFPRKSSLFRNFLDPPTWLELALEARFRALAGTILGTLSSTVDHTVDMPDAILSQRPDDAST